ARDVQASVREPVRCPTESIGALSDHLAVAVQIDGDDLPRSPVRKPQATVVPPRGLGHCEAVQQYAGMHPPSSVAVIHTDAKVDEGSLVRAHRTRSPSRLGTPRTTSLSL